MAHFHVLMITGLTDAEVEKAVQLAEQQGALAPASTNQNAVISRPVVAPSLPPRPPAPPPRERSWSEYAVMVAVVGGIGYAVVYFVRVSLQLLANNHPTSNVYGLCTNCKIPLHIPCH